MNTLHRYAVRIHASAEALATFFAIWVPYCRTIIAYQHDEANRLHCHLAVETYYDKKTLKNEALKKYKFNGQGDWSFKIWDGEEKYLVYCSKGKYLPCYLHAVAPEEWTEEKFTRIRDAWIVREKEMTKLEEAMDILGDYADIRREWDEQSGLQNGIKCEFEYLLKVVQRYLMLRNGNWSQGTFALYKSIVYSYVMWNGIYIPETRKEWRRFL